MPDFIYPKGSIQPDKSRPRMTHADVLKITGAILSGKIRITRNSGILGEHGEEWVDVEARGYHLNFWVRGSSVTNVFMARTPKGREYSINDDGGNPLLELPVEDSRKLTALLIAGSLRVIQCWRLARENPPELSDGLMIYNTEQGARRALRSIRQSQIDYDKNKTKTKKKGQDK